LLAVNGGCIVLTKPWAQYLLEQMGYMKRKATSSAKVTVDDLASLERQFLLDIRGIVEMEEIAQDSIINWDQSTIPVSNWTMVKEGTHKVSISGMDDKRQITLVLAASMTGKLLLFTVSLSR